MKELITRTWCDRCHQLERPQTEATVARTIALDSRRPLALDLCEPCDKELFAEPLVNLLADYGQPVATLAPASSHKRPSDTAQTPCPVCATVIRGSSAHVAQHIWSLHIGKKRPPSPMSCPECDWASERPSQTGTAKHRIAAHGFDPMAEAVAVYEASLKPAPDPVRSARAKRAAARRAEAKA